MRFLNNIEGSSGSNVVGSNGDWLGNVLDISKIPSLSSLYAPLSHTHSYDNYQSWNLKTGGIQRTTVTSGGNLDIVGGTNVSVSYSAGGVVTISSTDTNTWRGIDDTPVNGVTTESISSNWAYDHAASSTAHPRDTRNQIAGTYNTIIGTDADVNTSGATIIDNLYMTDGVITSHGTRTLTASDFTTGTLGIDRLASKAVPYSASELSASVDLNTLKTNSDVGFYYQTANADTTGNNYPSGQAGSLLVQKGAGNSSGQVTQMYITYDSTPEMYFRSFYTANTQGWTKAWSSNDFSSSDVSNWNTAYGWGNHASGGYAPLASPTFTGTPAAPTAAAGTNTTQLATTAFVGTAVSNLVDSAPGTLDTLNELAAALGDDPNFATTVTNSIATKLPLAGGTMTGDINIQTNLIKGGSTSHDYLDFDDDSTSYSAGVNATVLSSVSDLVLRTNANDGGGGEFAIWTGSAASGSAIMNLSTSGVMSTGDGFTSTKGNTAYTHSQAAHAPSNAEANVYSTASELLTAIKTVDGSGTGLDADTVDGIQAASFLRSDANDTATGNINFTGTPTISGNTIWNAGNDGAGSGLDADLLDGNHASAFALSSHTHSYVPLSGGTMTGDLTVPNAKVTTGVLELGTYGTTEQGILKINGSTANKQSILKTTNGNLHIDAADGHNLYLNYYTGGTGDNIIFGNGNGGTSGAKVTNGGVIYATGGNSGNWNTAYTHSQAAHAPANAEQNVQSDWNAVSGDAHILNKPTIPSGNQIIDWTVDQGATNIHAGNYTDTNTWRGIDDVPVNGQTAESISSNWAYDHANASNPHSITPALIGAATSSHTHAISTGYSGSITAGGSNGTMFSLDSRDTRTVNQDPDDFNHGVLFEFKTNSTTGLSDGGSYHGLMHWRSYGNGTDLSGGYPAQIAYTASANLWMRLGTSGTTWGSWRRFLHTGDLDNTPLTGVPTAPTAAAGTNTTQLATTAFVSTAVSNLVDSAPTTLDTLNELAAALGDDANFSATMSTALGNRLRVDTASQGLTSTQKSNARTNLGLGTAATSTATDFVAVSGDTMTGDLQLGANQLLFTQSNVAAPSTTDQHAGTRILLYPNTNGTHYAIGIQSSNMWFNSDGGYKWYRDAVTSAMVLDGSSNLSVTGNVTGANLNISNWNTAYGWGDHSTAGYAASSHTHNTSDIVSGTFDASRFSVSTRYSIGLIAGNGTNTRDKLRVWGSGAYAIGMKSGYSYGALGGAGTQYAMSFQMDTTANRGFWWGDNGHTDAQGAMSLTTNGKLTVATSIRVGYGETDTTDHDSAYKLHVNGNIHMGTGSGRVGIKTSGADDIIQFSNTSGSWNAVECKGINIGDWNSEPSYGQILVGAYDFSIRDDAMSSIFFINNSTGNTSIKGHLQDTSSDKYSIDLKDHGDHAWFRNQHGAWSFQTGTSGDDWTQTFTLTLPAAGATVNAVWAELGQTDSNDVNGGRYRGLRIVKDTGGVVDGDLRAGAFYIGTTRKDQNWDDAYAWGDHTGLYTRIGGDTMTGNLTIDHASVAQIFLDSAAGNDAVLNFHENAVQKGKIGYDSSLGGIAFVAGNGAFSTADVVVLDNGNTGLGTTTPSHKLHVAGQTFSTNGYKLNNGSVEGFLTGDTNNTNIGSITAGKGLALFAANTEYFRVTPTGRLYTLNTGSSVFLGEAAGFSDDLSANNNVYIGYYAGYNGTTARQNVAIGYIALQDNTTGSYNTAVGLGTLADNTTASANTAIGYQVMRVSTTAADNSGVGYHSLRNLTTGVANTALGRQSLYSATATNYNTAVGSYAAENTTSDRNSAFGYAALNLNTTGTYNVALGMQSLNNATTANNNTAVGYRAMYVNTTGHTSAAVGFEALYSNTTGQDNVAIGSQVLRANTTASRNTGVGKEALRSNTTAVNTTTVGYRAGYTNTTGSNNTAVGSESLLKNTTGVDNVAVGQNALYWNTASENTAVGRGAMQNTTTGANNAAVGKYALYSNTTGGSNAAFGQDSLRYNTAGASNVAVGQSALRANTTASNNTAVGRQAMYSNTTGHSNAALGHNSMLYNTTGTNNTAVGRESLLNNTTASNNTTLGYNSMRNNTTGAYGTAVGKDALKNNTTATGNSALGYRALYLNTIGTYNTAIGYAALQANTTGSYNVAVGMQALLAATSGSNNVALGADTLRAVTTGTSNIAIGRSALESNTASDNTAVGTEALKATTTSGNNTALGYRSGYSNTTGGNNVIVGHNAMRQNTTGANNVAVGSHALYANTTANYNTAVGFQAMRYTTTGAENTAVGREALMQNTTGARNVAVGYHALENNTTGVENVAVGRMALESNTTANHNTAVGYLALFENTTGHNNTAMGRQSGRLTTTGLYNVSVGAQSLYSNTTASYNTAIGYEALYNSTTANYNSAVGTAALYAATTGHSNAASGYRALRNLTTGVRNAGLGYQALHNITTSSDNVAVGYFAGKYYNGSIFVTGASDSVFLGSNTQASGAAVSNEVVIGADAVGQGAGTVMLGNSSATNGVFAYGSYNEISDVSVKENVATITDATEKVKAMRGVTYNKIGESATKVGVIAQEIEAVLPEVVAQGASGLKSVSYGNIVGVLIEALKEQEARIASLEAQINNS